MSGRREHWSEPGPGHEPRGPGGPPEEPSRAQSNWSNGWWQENNWASSSSSVEDWKDDDWGQSRSPQKGGRAAGDNEREDRKEAGCHPGASGSGDWASAFRAGGDDAPPTDWSKYDWSDWRRAEVVPLPKSAKPDEASLGSSEWGGSSEGAKSSKKSKGKKGKKGGKGGKSKKGKKGKTKANSGGPRGKGESELRKEAGDPDGPSGGAHHQGETGRKPEPREGHGPEQAPVSERGELDRVQAPGASADADQVQALRELIPQLHKMVERVDTIDKRLKKQESKPHPADLLEDAHITEEPDPTTAAQYQWRRPDTPLNSSEERQAKLERRRRRRAHESLAQVLAQQADPTRVDSTSAYPALDGAEASVGSEQAQGLPRGPTGGPSGGDGGRTPKRQREETQCSDAQKEGVDQAHSAKKPKHSDAKEQASGEGADPVGQGDQEEEKILEQTPPTQGTGDASKAGGAAPVHPEELGSKNDGAERTKDMIRSPAVVGLMLGTIADEKGYVPGKVNKIRDRLMAKYSDARHSVTIPRDTIFVALKVRDENLKVTAAEALEKERADKEEKEGKAHKAKREAERKEKCPKINSANDGKRVYGLKIAKQNQAQCGVHALQNLAQLPEFLLPPKEYLMGAARFPYLTMGAAGEKVAEAQSTDLNMLGGDAVIAMGAAYSCRITSEPDLMSPLERAKEKEFIGYVAHRPDQGREHWYTIKPILLEPERADAKWYRLDSLEPAPMPMGNEDLMKLKDEHRLRAAFYEEQQERAEQQREGDPTVSHPFFFRGAAGCLVAQPDASALYARVPQRPVFYCGECGTMLANKQQKREDMIAACIKHLNDAHKSRKFDHIRLLINGWRVGVARRKQSAGKRSGGQRILGYELAPSDADEKAPSVNTGENSQPVADTAEDEQMLSCEEGAEEPSKEVSREAPQSPEEGARQMGAPMEQDRATKNEHRKGPERAESTKQDERWPPGTPGKTECTDLRGKKWTPSFGRVVEERSGEDGTAVQVGVKHLTVPAEGEEQQPPTSSDDEVEVMKETYPVNGEGAASDSPILKEADSDKTDSQQGEKERPMGKPAPTAPLGSGGSRTWHLSPSELGNMSDSEMPDAVASPRSRKVMLHDRTASLLDRAHSLCLARLPQPQQASRFARGSFDGEEEDFRHQDALRMLAWARERAPVTTLVPLAKEWHARKQHRRGYSITARRWREVKLLEMGPDRGDLVARDRYEFDWIVNMKFMSLTVAGWGDALEEELDELEQEVVQGEALFKGVPTIYKVVNEIGDVIFCLACLNRHDGLDIERGIPPQGTRQAVRSAPQRALRAPPAEGKKDD